MQNKASQTIQIGLPSSFKVVENAKCKGGGARGGGVRGGGGGGTVGFGGRGGTGILGICLFSG